MPRTMNETTTALAQIDQKIAERQQEITALTNARALLAGGTMTTIPSMQKRGPGRPRTVNVITPEQASAVAGAPAPRKRGRPRKTDAPTPEAVEKVTKPRGRPRKTPVEVGETPDTPAARKRKKAEITEVAVAA